ncbi:hypothetical protein TPHV1_10299 [Treponema phagedenis]|uniref:Uncharacterized protein n=1 Tax=Treponema phagedenis TaxID=162 RepID=A0A0B7GVD5_TREPH|nr:hypothetical protein TPHV1_10299 [Treponema phagedenis]
MEFCRKSAETVGDEQVFSFILCTYILFSYAAAGTRVCCAI